MLIISQGHQSLEDWGSQLPGLGQGVVGLVERRGRVVKYYYILSCTGGNVCWKVVTFEDKIICPEEAVNGQILPENSILLNCLKNRHFSEISLKKLKFFCEIALKIEICRKFAWKNRFFLDPDLRPPYFKPD